MIPPLDPGWAALFVTVFGGIILEIVRKFLNKRQQTVDEATRLRGELREQIEDLKEDIKALETERDRYRDEYYELYSKYIAQATELTLALRGIKPHTEKDKSPPDE